MYREGGKERNYEESSQPKSDWKLLLCTSVKCYNLPEQ
jgi:hypothetical protein